MRRAITDIPGVPELLDLDLFKFANELSSDYAAIQTNRNLGQAENSRRNAFEDLNRQSRDLGFTIVDTDPWQNFSSDQELRRKLFETGFFRPNAEMLITDPAKDLVPQKK